MGYVRIKRCYIKCYKQNSIGKLADVVVFAEEVGDVFYVGGKFGD